jgi:3-deoxy-D-manno-octulosonate 8-phosphate phosphatase (KDO 8-P phosphatase)
MKQNEGVKGEEGKRGRDESRLPTSPFTSFPSAISSEEVKRRAELVKLLLLDCDGVMTDGRITLVEGGEEQKSFHTRDGHGLVLLHRAGLRSGIISGRTSRLVELRAADLGIAFVRQGALNKVEVFDALLAEASVEPTEVAYVGDDVVDIPLMRRSGLAVAVADATEDTRSAAHYVTHLPGGFGAVREVCEMILKAQGRWAELMKRYTD